MANALGSGLIESPAMLAYLPAICRDLLGEDLKMPSVPTWWCGEPGALDHVLANLPRMVIKPTVRLAAVRADLRRGAERDRSVSDAGRDDPRAAGRVRRPGAGLQLSTAPVLAGDGLQPAAPRAPRLPGGLGLERYAVMPGGLTRIAASADTLVVSMQKGGGSKDTWVLSDGPVSTFSLLPATVQPVELSRDGGDLPSRAADNLFWLGRYVERVEAIVRLLPRDPDPADRAVGSASSSPRFRALLRALEQLDADRSRSRAAAGSDGTARRPGTRADSRSIGDASRPGSLAASIHGLHRVAAKVRDRLSLDMWRILSTPRTRRAGPQGSQPRDTRSADRLRWRAVGASPIERAARDPGPDGDQPGGLRRPGRREHDPRPGLAVPGHGPTARTSPADRDLAPRAPWSRRARPKRRCWRPSSRSPTAP